MGIRTKTSWHEEKFFGDHSEPEDRQRYAAITEAARVFAGVMAENAPEYSNETRSAVRAVQEAALWAKEAIRIWRPKPEAEHACPEHHPPSGSQSNDPSDLSLPPEWLLPDK
jgi:hypothetical protein